MKKKFLAPALAITIIGGGVGGSILTTSVFASSDNNSKTEVSDVQDQKELAKEAAITKEEATSAALKKVKGEVKESELENEDGTLVYGFEITDDKGNVQDVKVDAKTGKVLKVEADDENEKGDEEENEDNDGEVSDEKEQQQLAKEATVTKEEATATALKEVKGQVKEVELDDEDGTVVYGVEITDDKGKVQDVKVDAKTGKVLKVEADEENEKGDEEENEDNDGEVSDEKEQQQLAKEATVTKEEATATALKEVKGQVKEVELDDEDGTVVYGVEITDDNGKVQDVKVDAKTGKVLKVEADDENESEGEGDQE